MFFYALFLFLYLFTDKLFHGITVIMIENILHITDAEIDFPVINSVQQKPYIIRSIAAVAVFRLKWLDNFFFLIKPQRILSDA